MRKRLIVLMLGAATGAFAHHGYDSHYDGTRLISLKGRVVSFSIENPHTRIVIKVADARGQKETWTIGTVPASRAAQMNHPLTSARIKPGDLVTVAG